MKKILERLFVWIPCLILLISCKNSQPTADNSQVFTKELQELQEFFKVPGISAVVAKDQEIIYQNYTGYANVERQQKVASTTAFPIASITKLYSAVLVFKLIEAGKLSLSDPVSNYVPAFVGNDSIRVKHLLSHTSQGELGKRFYYSSRFGLLTTVLEKASGTSFKELMKGQIINPLALQSTFLLEDKAQVSGLEFPFASPYLLEDQIQEGFIDYGYSASAGIVTTAQELLQFSTALDLNTLITDQSTRDLYNGIDNNLPYAYGIFSQKVQGVNILWVYGQYDCYSSLLIKVPEQNLSLVLLANNNLMSDPARLIMGNATSSLFALSFLKNYVLNEPEMPLFEEPQDVFNSGFNSEFYKQKVLAQALAEAFMARYETPKMQTSAALVEQVFNQYPELQEYADINLLHTLSFLKSVAFYRDLGAFNTFDAQLEQIGQKLLLEDPNNPYVHSYLGTYYDRKGDIVKAAFHFKSIVDLENFAANWYTKEAQQWLEQYQ